MSPKREPTRRRPARIVVLAGVNGAGKSSVAGATQRVEGADYYNPDEATQQILAANPGADLAAANAAAWAQGKRLLERAIAEKLDYTFETTLGGNTIVGLLERAADAGLEVAIVYVGLASVEQHLARVNARVARGGHDIPEAKIRSRYDQSRKNLIRLLPRLHDLYLWDNSVDAAPHDGTPPVPVLLLEMHDGRIVQMVPLDQVPDWAKPIAMAALTGRRSG